VGGIKVKVDTVGLTDPTWSIAKAAPGDEVELSVTTKALAPGQSVELQISHDDALIAVLTKLTVSGTKRTAKWIVPAFPGAAKLTFTAVLREPPTPANGHVTSRGKARSGTLVVHGFKVAITSIDAAFVPGVEKLRVKMHLENPGEYNVEGAIMIWGERYPGDAALYTETISTPTVFGEIAWDSWSGKAGAGLLAGKLISPEFSPYRVQVMLWPVGKRSAACTAERGFEVAIESVELRIQQGLPQGVKDTLTSFLAIEPRAVAGTYADSGRLPAPGESARMRIPNAAHNASADSLSQGGNLVTDPYHASNSPSKWADDQGRYSRPEIPLEVATLLRSRDRAAHPSGIFSGQAVGPLRFEAFADDHYDDAVFRGSTLREKYWKDSLHKVKLGKHDAPVNNGTAPVIGLWQARVVIAADGDRLIDLARLDSDFVYAMGKNELTIYHGRARLNVGASGSGLDVEEISATRVQLRSNVTKAGDVVWIVRSDATAVGARAPSQGAAWRNFPPGINCHVQYGGVRGKAPWDLFRAAFSTAPVAPIIGAGAPFPYTANVNVDPDHVGLASERAETKALDSGAHQGLAGILFSPSFVAGDSYVLGAATAAFPYARTLGYFSTRPPKKASTGPLTVWRVITVKTSLRAADNGTKGYPATVGCPSDGAYATRPYPGNGFNMDLIAMNAEMGHSFNEWQVAPLVPPATDVHQDITTADYIAAHNAATTGIPGGVSISGAAGITNELVQFEYFRVKLPPGVPAADAAAMATKIAALPTPTTSQQAMAAAATALGAGGGATPSIPVFAGAGGINAYVSWIDSTVGTIAKKILDKLTPPVKPPKLVTVMSVVRWRRYYASSYWVSGTPTGTTYTQSNFGGLGWNGFAFGDGQSFFSADVPDPGLFPHEMAHTLQLTHFSAYNFSWKHHHLLWPDCLMSYGNGLGYIARPIGAVGPGAGARVDTGWPDLAPAPAPPAPPIRLPAIAITVMPTATHPQLTGKGELCGKCVLKLRGWKEEELPVAWRHPDLF
jgi:hypothetical protein